MPDTLSVLSKPDSPSANMTVASKQPISTTDENGAKSIPLHCVVENLREDNGSSGKDNVELDTYAILPASTLVCDLVRAALTKIGYTVAEAMGAKGVVQFRHWKPLTFDTITDNNDACLDEILGEHVSAATLRIRLCSKSRLYAVEDVREKLLQFLLHQSTSFLSTAGCPIDQSQLSKLTHGDYSSVILSDDMRNAFNAWYKEISKSSSPPVSPTTPSKDLIPATLPQQQQHQNLPPGVITVQPEETHRHSPYYIPNRTRVRTAFDPEHEIPMLNRWFEETQHPSREQMTHFLDLLNRAPYRQGSKALDLANIAHWFKNSRAARRRANKAAAGSDSNEEELDLSIDSERNSLSPRSPPSSSSSSQYHVPELPNRNAVYVVNPVYARSPRSDDRVEVVNFTDDREEPMQTDEDLKHEKSPYGSHTSPTMKSSPITEEAEDLSVRNRRPSSDSNSSAMGSNHSDYSKSTPSSERYLTPSPKSLLPSSHPHQQHQVAKTVTPTSLHYDQMRHQQALQMAAMSHALNMHYMHPAAALYPPLHASPSPGQNYGSLKDPNHNLTPTSSSPMETLGGSPSPLGMSADDRKKRSRVFIDPLTEIPKLEKWFIEDTHPSSYMIEKYTEELNRSTYRQRFPRLEPKNVQLWFKNHRAKVKRTRLEQQALSQASSSSATGSYHPAPPSQVTST